MRTAEFEIPPMEADAMPVPPYGTVPKRPFWDICWRGKVFLALMVIGFVLHLTLVFGG